MLSFKQFFKEDFSPDISSSHDGSTHTYSHKVGDKTVMTHFIKQDRGDGGHHYDVHFTRHGEGDDPTKAFDRKGMNKMSSEDRIKSIRSVMQSVKHFTKHNKPSSITASANTKQKSHWSHTMLSAYAARHGHKVVRSGSDTTVHF